VLSLGEDTARARLRQALMLGVLVGARRRLAPFLLSDAHERPTSGIYFLRPDEDPMRRTMVLIGLAMAASLGAGHAAAGNLELRVGRFAPRTDSNLFRDASELFTVSKKDWRGWTGGLEYNTEVTPQFEVGVSLDAYSQDVDTNYREFTRPDRREILQTLKLSVVPVGVSLRVLPLERHSVLRPYVAVGGDVIFWRYEEFGDFIDFRSANRNIVADSFRSEGVKLGAHVAAGLRLRLTHDLSATGEWRYLAASRATMGDDFEARPPDVNELDLTGQSFTFGVNLRF
jgi:opacity protein-like surface antigen